MNKHIFIIAVLISFSSLAKAELVSDKNDQQVNDTHLEILLERAPVNAQRKLLGNKKALKKQLEQIYLRRVLADMAVQEGLDKEGLNAARLQNIRNNALYLLKLDALRKSNSKDYTKYAQQLYQVNKTDYKISDRINAAHILISTKELSDAEALQKAIQIRQQLLLGADFSELAIKESDDNSVQSNKGELGTFTVDKMVKPFSDAALAMQAGEISEPIKTRYGYHIIKLNNKIAAGYKSFDEVKVSIINKLEAKDWEITRTKFFNQVINGNKMQMDDLAIDEFIIKKLDEIKKTALK